MKEYIAFDSHKHYTLAEREDVRTGRTRQDRIEHTRGAIRRYLSGCAAGTAVAVEAIGYWYWIVDEIEAAGCRPRLVHPRKAKLMMGMINKTDKLDVHGLNRLQRNGTLPTVWIAPGALRDVRELTRARIALGRDRTRLKNRIRSMLAKYGLQMTGFSDAFGVRARAALEKRVAQLPPSTRQVTGMLLEHLDFVRGQIAALEERLKSLVRETPTMRRLMSQPGIGLILSVAIALEVGDVARFPDGEHLAAYAGTTPRVHASGGKVRYGRCRPDVNRTLKWAYAEAANSVAVNHPHWPDRHVSQLYRNLRKRRGHSVAVGAVARHLAEATFHILSRNQDYRDPALDRGRAREA
jgi:transposase